MRLRAIALHLVLIGGAQAEVDDTAINICVGPDSDVVDIRFDEGILYVNNLGGEGGFVEYGQLSYFGTAPCSGGGDPADITLYATNPQEFPTSGWQLEKPWYDMVNLGKQCLDPISLAVD
jgi:hypothetical protein